MKSANVLSERVDYKSVEHGKDSSPSREELDKYQSTYIDCSDLIERRRKRKEELIEFSNELSKKYTENNIREINPEFVSIWHREKDRESERKRMIKTRLNTIPCIDIEKENIRIYQTKQWEKIHAVLRLGVCFFKPTFADSVGDESVVQLYLHNSVCNAMRCLSYVYVEHRVLCLAQRPLPSRIPRPLYPNRLQCTRRRWIDFWRKWYLQTTAENDLHWPFFFVFQLRVEFDCLFK